jgi:hypothetical protein
MTDCRRCRGTGREPPRKPPPVHLAGFGRGVRCGREQRYLDAPIQHTLIAADVTCGNCRRTTWWRAAAAEQAPL